MNDPKVPLLRLFVVASVLLASAFTSGCQSYIDAMNSIATSPGYSSSDSSSEAPDPLYRGYSNDASAPGIK